MADENRSVDGAGTPAAADELFPLVYAELRRLAARQLAQEKPGQTLDATALVHEVYVRLAGAKAQQQWSGRAHFFKAAGEAMRRILVEKARRRRRLRHGGGKKQQALDAEALAADETADNRLLAVDELLDQLAAEQEIAAQVVKLRFFAGLTIAQTADALEISVRTANRHWAYARAWLFKHAEQSS
jgi:RNA polymerase sigma factor (TIGR02999 family)